MTQIDRLIENYRRFASIPWALNAAGCQRVWCAVYPPAEERRLRARVDDFASATRAAGHGWQVIDVSNLPASWLAGLDYREDYFSDPSALAVLEEDFRSFAADRLRGACQSERTDSKAVLAVVGTGALFGFAHISSIIAAVENSIRGRLLVFFPGSYECNTYRFMDARNGFNYMAVPITCSERMFE